jgi:uncharacterized membrane protein YeaQ/YmgE (transglycosylase-associated protein family)
MFFGIIGWIAVGLIVGFIASKFVDLHGDDARFGVAAACAGGLVAAFMYTLISGAGVTAWNTWSVLSAAIGAVVGAVVWHAVRSRYVSRERVSFRRSY